MRIVYNWLREIVAVPDDVDTVAREISLRGFELAVKKTGIGKVLQLELRVRGRNVAAPIPGCGMLVVNPPWKFEAEARPLLEWLRMALAVEGAGGARVEWLVPE